MAQIKGLINAKGKNGGNGYFNWLCYYDGTHLDGESFNLTCGVFVKNITPNTRYSTELYDLIKIGDYVLCYNGELSVITAIDSANDIITIRKFTSYNKGGSLYEFDETNMTYDSVEELYTIAISDIYIDSVNLDVLTNDDWLIDSAGNIYDINQVDYDNMELTAYATSYCLINSGGGIPIVDIEMSQFLTQTTIQLTQSQYDTIINNMAFNMVITSGNSVSKTLFTGQDNGTPTIQFVSIQDNDTASPNALVVLSLKIDKSTLVATISQNSYEKSSGGGGKQLYQHNIHFKQVGSNATVYCEFQIINDKSSEYTLSPFKDLCYNNRILGKGNSSLTTAFKEIFTSYYYKDASNKSYNIYYGGYYSTSGAILTDLSTATDSNTTIEDEVVPL